MIPAPTRVRPVFMFREFRAPPARSACTVETTDERSLDEYGAMTHATETPLASEFESQAKVRAPCLARWRYVQAAPIQSVREKLPRGVGFIVPLPNVEVGGT
jgi:hypothetical protein